MNPERQQFLSLRDKPWRLTRQETAWMLGIQEADIVILMRAKLLKPLGNPAPNGEKYFSCSEVAELGKDRSWLDRASRLIAQYHRNRNEKAAAQREALSSAALLPSRSLPTQAA